MDWDGNPMPGWPACKRDSPQWRSRRTPIWADGAFITQRGVLDVSLVEIAGDVLRLEERVEEMPYVICEPCVGVKDKACVEICPVDCIYEGQKEGFPDMLFIHPEECIDCGVCQPECPVSAIFPEDDVPEEWASYIEINVRFFQN